MPLAVPPGTAGLAPTLGLEYSSQAGMGLLGQGWGLSGLSAITRCGKTIAQDGNTTAVKLSAEDSFCLDGRRLLLVSGTHGASAEYRTDIDNFSRIRASGSDPAVGPDSFRVEAKGGLIHTYGATADATIEAAGRSVRHTWALSRVEDRRGNYFSISYSENTSTGEYVPVQIRYTGNANSGLVPYNAVRLVYEARPDAWQTYLAGSPVAHTQRLVALRTYTNTAADGSGGSLVRDYRMAYRSNPTNGRSLMDSLSDCDNAGACLPATRFTWTERTAGANNFSAPGSGAWGGPVAVFASTAHKNVWNNIAAVDMNGDGRTDLIKSLENGTWQVCLSTGSGFNCQAWAGPNKKLEDVGMGDFNGDGRTDLAYSDGGSGYVCFSTGSSLDCRAASMGVGASDVIADLDGDGRDDFDFCYSQGNGSFSCQAMTTGQWGVVLEQAAVCPDENTLRKNLLADWDGDGKVDYLVINMWSPICPKGHVHDYSWGLFTTVNGGTQTGLVPGSATGLPRVTWQYGRVNPPGASTGQFNGDAYPDLVLENLSGSQISLCNGTGAGFVCSTPTVNTAQYDHTVYHVGDVDGDGRSDTVHFGASGQARICQVGGQGGGNASYTCADWSGGSGPARMYGDFNADGKTDLAYYNETTQQWSIGLADGPVPDLLQAVTNGLGQVSEFSHAALSSAGLYTPGADVAYPRRNQAPVMTVVSQMRTGNAVGGWLSTGYSYEGLRTDLQGRGPLGFSAVKSTDQASGISTTTRYSQDYPSTGLPVSVTAVSAGGVVLSASTNTLAAMSTAAGAQYPYVLASTVATKDLNGAAQSTASTQVDPGGIDAWGNVTSSTATTVAGGESFSTTTQNTYDNLTTPWLIGLLRSSRVTRSATQSGTETSAPILVLGNCSSSSPTTAPSAATMTCTLANSGQSAATAIAYATPAGTSVSGPANCAALNPNCGMVTVSSGTAAGSYSGSVSATPTPAGSAASAAVSLVVNAAALPVLGASPTSLAWGTVPKDRTNATKSVTVSNSGAAATTLGLALSYTSGSSANGLYNLVSGTCVSGGSLAAGASCTINVYYQSGCTSGARNATLNITGTSATAVPVALTATTSSGACN